MELAGTNVNRFLRVERRIGGLMRSQSRDHEAIVASAVRIAPAVRRIIAA
jgi:hypothetical protein